MRARAARAAHRTIQLPAPQLRPLEPFDDSMPEILGKNGVHAHLASDHPHYWKDGGATYHPHYTTGESFLGQEGDPWKAHVSPDGGHVNVTDGRYVYMRACATPENTPLEEYTLMPIHMRGWFAPAEFRGAELAEPFPFMKEIRPLWLRGRAQINPYVSGTVLFDLQEDPAQKHPLDDAELELRVRPCGTSGRPHRQAACARLRVIPWPGNGGDASAWSL